MWKVEVPCFHLWPLKATTECLVSAAGIPCKLALGRERPFYIPQRISQTLVLCTTLWGSVGAWTLGVRNLTSFPIFSEYSPPTCFKGVSEAHTFFFLKTRSNYKWWNWSDCSRIPLCLQFEAPPFCLWSEIFPLRKFSQDAAEAFTRVLALLPLTSGLKESPWLPLGKIVPDVPDVPAAFAPGHLSVFPGWSWLLWRTSSGSSVERVDSR